MIKACIFDMYETLVSLFVGRVYFCEDFVEDMNLPSDEYVKAWHENEDDRTMGKITIAEGGRAALEKIGRYSKEAVEHLVKKRHESQVDTFSMVPKETFELLDELKKRGIKIGLISNCFSDERDMIRASSLMPYFDAVKLSYEQGLKKPDLVLFNDIAKELGVETSECIYVGDGGSHELEAATEAGMKAIQANWFRPIMLEGHIPCGVMPQFIQAEKQTDILKYLEE